MHAVPGAVDDRQVYGCGGGTVTHTSLGGDVARDLIRSPKLCDGHSLQYQSPTSAGFLKSATCMGAPSSCSTPTCCFPPRLKILLRVPSPAGGGAVDTSKGFPSAAGDMRCRCDEHLRSCHFARNMLTYMSTQNARHQPQPQVWYICWSCRLAVTSMSRAQITLQQTSMAVCRET